MPLTQMHLFHEGQIWNVICRRGEEGSQNIHISTFGEIAGCEVGGEFVNEGWLKSSNKIT